MRRSACSFLALLPALVLSLSAQITVCPPVGDDGFAATACCAPAQPIIPTNFGTVQTSGVYGCIANCGQATQFNMRARFDWQPLLCDYATIQASFIPSQVGAPTLAGTLFAKYSRTFIELEPTGQPVQVWRYLVNGDFIYTQTTATGVPCPIPATSLNQRPIHFFGSIDYRCGANTGTLTPYTVRYDLTHLPQCISNGPFSTRPIPPMPGMPSMIYAIVGPAPFAFAPVPAPVGFSVGESQRSSRVNWAPFAYQCLAEKSMQAQIQTVGANCACVPSTGVVPLFTEQQFQGRVICNGAVTPYTSIPLPGLTAGGVLTLSLGIYPATGTEVSVYLGLFEYVDPCTQEGPFHIVAGSGTRNPTGYRFFNTPVGMLNTAIDLGNSLNLSFFPPTLAWGSPYVSTQVWSYAL